MVWHGMAWYVRLDGAIIFPHDVAHALHHETRFVVDVRVS